MSNKIKVTMACEDDGFIPHILSLTGLDIHDKLGILEYAANEMFIKGDNLRMLEYKSAIKELHGK